MTLYLGHFRRSRSWDKVYGHMRKNVAKVVGATTLATLAMLCECFLVTA